MNRIEHARDRINATLLDHLRAEAERHHLDRGRRCTCGAGLADSITLSEHVLIAATIASLREIDYELEVLVDDAYTTGVNDAAGGLA